MPPSLSLSLSLSLSASFLPPPPPPEKNAKDHEKRTNHPTTQPTNQPTNHDTKPTKQTKTHVVAIPPHLSLELPLIGLISSLPYADDR
jgi:hypothetical protein